MNEAETRAELIDPALKAAGWGMVNESRVRREYYINKGRLQGGGKRTTPDIADYLLMYRGHPLAVVEAKKLSAHDTEGLQQAKTYAEKLAIRYAISTNGIGIYQVDMHTGQEGYINAFPTPEALWMATFPEQKPWRDRFADVPYEDGGGKFEPRFYQYNAIDAVLETIADGKDRILLTLATGTGKTAIAFQLAWKLFHSRWNLKDWKAGTEPSRRPRILFLADRNILANQAKNDFSAFPDDALARIDPAEIRKQGRVPKNASVFFTIFQTFMTGMDADGNPAPNFGQYPPDFFDFIIIDECHRGGAKDESTWRGILEYFKPAVQLGLTATPKRKDNVDTYKYFGEPVYVYSLKDGINDGFLTPFKVRQISTTLDEYVYTSDDEVLDGEIEEGRRYTEADFNRVIEIEGREAYRVKIFMEMIDQSQKTIVFCSTEDHALAVRNLINQMKSSKDPNYCVRVTSQEGKLGDSFLKLFQDNEKTIPTILTTSKKLSTGVNARNIRNIVLMRPVGNLIEFKQIVGRGTRLYDGKDYFTIYDFVKAYEHFNDPEWDGEPAEPVIKPHRPSTEPKPLPEPREPEGCQGDEEEQTRQRIRIKLADGKERSIQHMSSTSFWSADGRPMSAADFVQQLFGDLPALFKDETELRELWSRPDTRNALLEALYEKGYGPDQLGEIMKLIDAENSDLYDVLAYIAFAQSPITRQQRVEERRGIISAQYDQKLQAFIDFVLAQYVQEGVDELDQAKLPKLLTLKYHAIPDAEAILGSVGSIREAFIGFQRYLYGGAA
jgi:type I restriction enzyme R subunit